MKETTIFYLLLSVQYLGTVFAINRLLPFLSSHNMGQKILKIGPSWHQKKEGTPTMGGISFIGVFILCYGLFLLMARPEREILLSSLGVFLFCLLNGAVGFLDDWKKKKNQENKGLSARTKYFLQSVCAIFFLLYMKYFFDLPSSFFVPYWNQEIDLGIFSYVLYFLLLTGVVNSVNLTDGIDGLASSCVFGVGIFCLFVTLFYQGDVLLYFYDAILLGASLGFLVFNLHPAKIFMGDTGSLFFGALVVSFAFVIQNPFIALVYGFPFVFESISVILQVFYFKLSKGKRIFKMTPFHHHLEKCGLSENKIVLLFFIATLLCGILAFFGCGNL